MASVRRPQSFRLDLIKLLGARAVEIVKPNIRSEQLRRNFKLRIKPGEYHRGLVGVNEYWAQAAHNGRRRFGPAPGKTLVFYPNPKDDPRTERYGYPISRRNRFRLTADQYKAGMRENARRRRLGAQPFMIVIKWPYGGSDTDSVGDTYAKKNPFLDSLSGFGQEAAVIVARETKRYAKERLLDALR